MVEIFVHETVQKKSKRILDPTSKFKVFKYSSIQVFKYSTLKHKSLQIGYN